MRESFAPMPRLASTNSRWANIIVLARESRTIVGMPTIASAMPVLVMAERDRLGPAEHRGERDQQDQRREGEQRVADDADR